MSPVLTKCQRNCIFKCSSKLTLMESYFKIRDWFKSSSHRYEVGRPFAKNTQYADNFFLLKIYELDDEEYAAFYNFHLQHYLKANLQGEQEFYEHVWYIVNARIKYHERQSPFSDRKSTRLNSSH